MPTSPTRMATKSKFGMSEAVALGFRAHSRWAAVVAVSGSPGRPVVLERRRIEPVGELPFGLALCLTEGIAKALVGGKRLEIAQLAEVRDPTVADGLGDGSGERGVRLLSPTQERLENRAGRFRDPSGNG